MFCVEFLPSFLLSHTLINYLLPLFGVPLPVTSPELIHAPLLLQQGQDKNAKEARPGLN